MQTNYKNKQVNLAKSYIDFDMEKSTIVNI